MSIDPPRAQGQRLGWEQLPEHIRKDIESWLGEPVAGVQSMAGGFSPGLAARIVTVSGRKAFAKAVCRIPNAVAPKLHRREIKVASSLPLEAPAPRLLWSSDDHEGDGWVVLLFEDVEGRPPAHPWVADELDQVIVALNELTADLTPSPIPASEIGGIESWDVLFQDHWSCFEDDELAPPDPWVTRNLDKLIAAERHIAAVVGGNTLLHLDLRGDNMLLTDHGVVIVDWPHARVGAPWIDAVFFAPSVAMEQGLQPEELIARLDATRDADPEHLTLGIIGVAGFFTHHGALPPVDGLPGLREFQEAQGAVARRWVAVRTGWE